MGNEKKLQTISEVVKIDELSEKRTVGEIKRELLMFLQEVEIPRQCFVDEHGWWVFNEEGEKLLVDFVLNRGNRKKSMASDEKVYHTLRAGKVKKRDRAKYCEIIDRTVSNLEGIIATIESDEEAGAEEIKKRIERYPLPVDVYCAFWRCMYQKAKDIFFLPWMALLKEYEDDIWQVRERYMEDDVLFFGMLMMEELKELATRDLKKREYLIEKDLLIEKWVEYFEKAIAYRRIERIATFTVYRKNKKVIMDIMTKICAKRVPGNGKLRQERILYRKRCEKEMEYMKRFGEAIEMIQANRHLYKLPRALESKALYEMMKNHKYFRNLMKLRKSIKRKNVRKAKRIRR